MKWFRRFWPYALLVILVAGNLAVWIQRQQIADWWRLRNYQAPASIAQLASDDTMTPYATHLFYVNHPVLEDKQSFNMHCADKSEETAVLGCYHGNRQGIYIYDVTDPRLAGVEQVTAAHEMLHQAYDRLSSKDRQHVDQLLQNYYDTGLQDQDIKAKIESYKQQGADVVNEMHSVFGSEVGNLPPELENYYKQYFTNRAKIVAYSSSYQAEFTRRKDQVAQYDAQLSGLKDRINNNKSDLNTKLNALQALQKQISQDVTNKDQNQYNADVSQYNAMVEAYNSELSTTHGLITQYNNIVAQRNDLAVQEQQLQEALDSRLTPTQKQ
jgi:hypothetical protein